MKDIQLLAVFAENRPGQVAHFTKILAKANINILWATVASSSTFGVMKFLVDEPKLAFDALKHEGYVAKLMNVLAVEVENKPGGLFAIADCLTHHNINLDNASGFIANNRAILILEVPNVELGREVLQKQGFRVLIRKELLAFGC